MTANAGLTPERINEYVSDLNQHFSNKHRNRPTTPLLHLIVEAIASEATASLRAALTTTTQQRDKLTRTIEVASRTFEEILRREALKRVTAEEESRALQAALRAKATE